MHCYVANAARTTASKRMRPVEWSKQCVFRNFAWPLESRITCKAWDLSCLKAGKSLKAESICTHYSPALQAWDGTTASCLDTGVQLAKESQQSRTAFVVEIHSKRRLTEPWFSVT